MQLLFFAFFLLPWPALAADSDPYGQWEGELDAENLQAHKDIKSETYEVHFNQDGTFELHIRTVFAPEYDFWAGLDKVDSSVAERVDTMSLTLQGQWETPSNDELILTAESASATINDKDMLTVMAEALVRTRAIEEGYNEEQIQILIDATVKIVDPQEGYAGFITNLNERNPYYYNFEGNTLAAEINGHVIYLHEVGGTAVKDWSWGRIKSAR